MFATRTLEFDRIVADVAALSLTPLGRVRLEAVKPVGRSAGGRDRAAGDQRDGAVLRAEPRVPAARRPGPDRGARGSGHRGPAARAARAADAGRVHRLGGALPRGHPGARRATSPSSRPSSAASPRSRDEIAAVRDAIDVSGEVLDEASPALRSIRERLRQLRAAAAPHARAVRPRQGHGQVPAGRCGDGAQRTVRAAGASRAPRQRARASCTAARRAAPACSSSPPPPSRSTTTSSNSRSASGRRSSGSCWP